MLSPKTMYIDVRFSEVIHSQMGFDFFNEAYIKNTKFVSGI